MKSFSWDNKGFFINGERKPLISGELHYFRVPYKDWRFRLEKLKESGANAVSTYVPWFVHEPNEGEFLFDDIECRKLGEFLNICNDLDLLVFFRPGPYIYSELTYSGLPEWVYKNYPEISAERIDGSRIGSASYLQPVYLEKVKKYIKRIVEYVKPYITSNGGPVAAIQLDNEIAGIHIWNGTLDYNPISMGFGTENGRYPQFLKRRYNTVEAVSEAYGFKYSSFSEVDPRKPQGELTDNIRYRISRDYSEFYSETMAEYAGILANWIREEGIDVPLYLNAPVEFIPRAKQSLEMIPKPIFVGTDHYFNLGQNYKGNSPSPQEFMKWTFSLDMLSALEMPPTVFEMQSGSFADYPPMLPEDLRAMYFAHAALGLKGINYYIFTGGLNIKDSGETSDIFDFNAVISADNKIRPTYNSIVEYNKFALENNWLQEIQREFDVQLGFTWEQYCDGRFGPEGMNAADYMHSGLFTALMCAGYQPKYVELGQELDASKLLIVSSEKTMSQSKQENIVEFLKKGGRLIITPIVPEYDECAQKCTILKDYLAFGDYEFANDTQKMISNKDVMYYYISNQRAYSSENAEVLAYSQHKKLPLALYKKVGESKCILFGGEFVYTFHSHADLITFLCEKLGCNPKIQSDNKTVWFTSFSNGSEKMLFVLNLYSGTQEAKISADVDGERFDIGSLKLPPMTVLPIKLK